MQRLLWHFLVYIPNNKYTHRNNANILQSFGTLLTHIFRDEMKKMTCVDTATKQDRSMYSYGVNW